MRTCIQYGPHCCRKETKQWQISLMYSIPCAPSWVSNIIRNIWCSSTAAICIDTSRHKFGVFGHLILGCDLSICCQNQAEVETKDATFWVWELLIAEARKGKPQPIEKRTDKIWSTSGQPVQAASKEGQWEYEERY
jgi:hypothetical protein